MKSVAVLALAVATALSSFLPAEALPVVSGVTSPPSAVELAQYYDRGRPPGRDQNWNGGRPPGRDQNWNRRPPPGRYNGYRGYRDHRPGYRRGDDGWWYPLAAFGAGALIGGAIASQPAQRPPEAGINPKHVQWCMDRYRSYRSFDNTYAASNGSRQQCYSPYF